MWPKHLIFLLFSSPLPGQWHLRAIAGAISLCWLAGCGQQGALYLPTEPAAAQRATLPETLLPGKRTAPAASAANLVDPMKPVSPIIPAKAATP